MQRINRLPPGCSNWLFTDVHKPKAVQVASYAVLLRLMFGTKGIRLQYGCVFVQTMQEQWQQQMHQV